MILIGSCQTYEKEEVLAKEEVKQEMMDYLTNEYHEEFEMSDMDEVSWYNGYIDTMYTYPKGENENYYFYVRRKGKNQISDNYSYLLRGRYTIKKQE